MLHSVSRAQNLRTQSGTRSAHIPASPGFSNPWIVALATEKGEYGSNDPFLSNNHIQTREFDRQRVLKTNTCHMGRLESRSVTGERLGPEEDETTPCLDRTRL